MCSQGVQTGIDQRARVAREVTGWRAARSPDHAAGDGQDSDRVHARPLSRRFRGWSPGFSRLKPGLQPRRSWEKIVHAVWLWLFAMGLMAPSDTERAPL